MRLDLPLDSPRQEAFAQARARGVPKKDASLAAGYRDKNQPGRLEKNETVRARIRVILERRAGGGSRDIGGVIDKLIALAERAASGEDARGWDVARHCLSEAARLKGGLSREAPLAAPGTPRELTLEEWRARHDPASRGG